MLSKTNLANQILITISVVFGAIALVFACVGIGTPSWQTTSMNTTSGVMRIVHTANFFYACRLDLAGEVLDCGQRSTNSNIIEYYSIDATGNETVWNFHLDTAAGLSIIGIVFIFFGTVSTMFMLFGERAEWIYLVAPSFYFLACLSMLGGLAEGSRVLIYNGYSANLYEIAHLVTIFSFLLSAIVGGRLFDPPDRFRQPKRLRRIK